MHWLGLLGLGAVSQAGIIAAMRQYEISFWVLLPVSILMQWLFMTAYASKDAAFTVIWFTATGLTALVSLLMGLLLFKDSVTPTQWLGIAVILAGVVLTQTGKL